MRITLEFPEGAFLTPKTLQQATVEVREAAVRFWIARGELPPEAANDVTAPPSPTKAGELMEVLLGMPEVGKDTDFERRVESAPGGPGDFKAFLLSMPDEGDDSLFERPLDHGREVDLCDT
jgi:hypothetical protein